MELIWLVATVIKMLLPGFTIGLLVNLIAERVAQGRVFPIVCLNLLTFGIAWYLIGIALKTYPDLTNPKNPTLPYNAFLIGSFIGVSAYWVIKKRLGRE